MDSLTTSDIYMSLRTALELRSRRALDSRNLVPPTGVNAQLRSLTSAPVHNSVCSSRGVNCGISGALDGW